MADQARARDGVTIEETGGTLRITVSGVTFSGVLGLLGSLIPIVAALPVAAGGAPGLAVVLATPFLFIAYWQLARAIDRRTVTVDRAAITVTLAPLPLPQAAPIPLAEVRKILHLVLRTAWGIGGHAISAQLDRRLVPLLVRVPSEARAKEVASLLAARVAAAQAGATAATPAFAPSSPVTSGVAAPAPAPAPRAVTASVPATRAAPSAAPQLDRVVRSVAAALGVDPHALLGTIPALGTVAAAKLRWSDVGDALGVVVPWTPSSDASFKVLSISDRTQSKTFPILRAAHTPAFAVYTTVGRRPDLLGTSFAMRGPIDPSALLGSLVGVTIVKASAGAAVAAAWPDLGVACDLAEDVAQPPLGPNVWRFSGPVAPTEIVRAVDTISRRLGLLDAHRAVASRLAGGTTLRIGLEAGYDVLLPHLWLTTEGVSFDEAHALVAAATADAPRAERVVRALAAAGITRPCVALRIGVEDPVRVRVEGDVG